MNEREENQNENLEESVNDILPEGKTEANKIVSRNEYFRKLMDRNFLEYASYVIRDRAIPDVDDGLKPVQRRILWGMHRIDEGGTKKAANIVGEVMGKYHPHGDASIKDALTVLANKEYFIEKQGNFGNIISGSAAAAARYIECGLTPLAREVLFNDDITPLVDTYDGRNQEPVVLPVKIPSLLMLGSDGIAVGMATKIMPHNFNELLNAQISILKGEEYEVYPDFLQGGVMDVSEYNDGNGKITVRAKIEVDNRELVIREIPYTTTTESLMASIEKASDKNKIKITSVKDYTAAQVEIRILLTRGYEVGKAIDALYMYTDCSVSISANLTVIRENRPAQMSIHEVLERNTKKLLEYLKLEYENELHRQDELHQAKTLAQIFFENRIYKRIEECKSEAEEYQEVMDGLHPFVERLRRAVSKEDVDRLLALPVRKISRFDIEKNQKELQAIDDKIAELRYKLEHLTDQAILYLQNLIEKYGDKFPRRTEIVKQLEKIDRSKAALSNIKIGWDRKNGYIGSSIKSDDLITCNEFDHILMIERTGKYKICNLPPEKFFVGKLYECRKYDPAQEFAIIYCDLKTKKYYGKRSVIDKFITDKEYMLCPDKCRIELLTPRSDAFYELLESNRRGKKVTELNLMTLPLRSAKARGGLLTANVIDKITHKRYLDVEELEAFRQLDKPEATESEAVESEAVESEAIESEAIEMEIKEAAAIEIKVEAESAPESVPEVAPEVAPEVSGEAEAEIESITEIEVDVEVAETVQATPEVELLEVEEVEEVKVVVPKKSHQKNIGERKSKSFDDDNDSITQPELF